MVRPSSFHRLFAAHQGFSLAIFGLQTEDSPNALRTLDEMFTTGLKVGRNQPFLGYRPIVSRDPLRFSGTFVWHTYGEVDDRRRYIGSALHTMFSKGEIGGGEYDTVGIWSQNRPGERILTAVQPVMLTSIRVADS